MSGTSPPPGFGSKAVEALLASGLLAGVNALTWGPLILIFGTELPWWEVLVADLAVFAGLTVLFTFFALLGDLLVGDEPEESPARRAAKARAQWLAKGLESEHRLLRSPGWDALAGAARARVRRWSIALLLCMPLALASGYLLATEEWLRLSAAFSIEPSPPLRLAVGALFALIVAGRLLVRSLDALRRPSLILVGTVISKQRTGAGIRALTTLLGAGPLATLSLRSRNGFEIDPEGVRRDVPELRRRALRLPCGVKLYDLVEPGQPVALVCGGKGMRAFGRLSDLRRRWRRIAPPARRKQEPGLHAAKVGG